MFVCATAWSQTPSAVPALPADMPATADHYSLLIMAERTLPSVLHGAARVADNKPRSHYMNSREAQPFHDSANAVSEAEDRRLHPRYTVQVPIEIHLEGTEGSNTPLTFETTDLSRGGCYIHITPQFALGKAVRATLWLDGFPAVIHCLVVTRHPEFGNGIMFMEFEGEGERLLARYLDAIIS